MSQIYLLINNYYTTVIVLDFGLYGILGNYIYIY